LVQDFDGGKDDDNPLYIDYPEKEEPAEKRRRMAPQNDQCKWLDEAVKQLPEVAHGASDAPWPADHTAEFTHNILGDETMGNKLVVRKCYVELYDKIHVEWLRLGGGLRRVGVCVVTGTPGIGKSVFMAFVAARLASTGCSIVMQRGRDWMSKKAGEGAVNHGGERPVTLLTDAAFVLLADPMGGDNRVAVEWRSAGCTIVFTSPHRRNYDTAWKQAQANRVQYFLPLWSEGELIKHKATVLAGVDDEKVKKGHSLLGGSVRVLQEFARMIGDSAEVAKQLIQRSIGAATSADLVKVCKVDPAEIEGAVRKSMLSTLLQIHTDNFKDAQLKLLDSDLAITVIRDQLDLNCRKERLVFLNTALYQSQLGALVGKLFEEEVLDQLTAKGAPCRKLTCMHLPRVDEAVPVEVQVPNVKVEVQTVAACAPLTQLMKDHLYHPLSGTFPAADLFFVVPNEGGKFTAQLLQTTKSSTHDCKIKAMIDELKKHFNNISQLEAVHWIVIAPAGIAQEYRTEQKVVGECKPGGAEVVVQQFVAEWPLEH
jgi:hypothetical protein